MCYGATTWHNVECSAGKSGVKGNPIHYNEGIFPLERGPFADGSLSCSSRVEGFNIDPRLAKVFAKQSP